MTELEPLSASHTLEYTYKRSVGPVLGRFFTGLRDGRIEGVKTRAGRVLCPSRAPMAVFASSGVAISTKPKPRDRPLC